MKKILILFAALAALVSCNPDIEDGSAQSGTEGGFAIKTFAPSKVVAGSVIQISGAGLDRVSVVEFAGGLQTSELTKVGNGLINVVVPKGITPGGFKLIADDGAEATANGTLTVGAPKVETVSPGDEAWIADIMTFTGVDMEFFNRVDIPGKNGTITFGEGQLYRRSTSLVSVKIPADIASGPGDVTIYDMLGGKKTFAIAKFVQGIRGAKGPLEGEWIWEPTESWGNGGYRTSPGPAWWILNVGEGLDGQGVVKGEGMPESMMTFAGPFMTKTRADGTTQTGTYSVDMESVKFSGWSGLQWSVGMVNFRDVSPLLGWWPVLNADNTKDEVFVYDLVSLTSTTMVLAHTPTYETAETNETAYFWRFKKNIADPTIMYVGKGEDLEIPDVGDDFWIDPDWFEKSGSKFKFLAETGWYQIAANAGLKSVTVRPLINDKDATLQADGTGTVWILGEGAGKPTLANAPGWNEGKGIPLAAIGGKRHKVTLTAGTQMNATTINFKLFHGNHWEGEFTHETLTYDGNLFTVGRGKEVNGGDPGNFFIAEGQGFEEGATYEFILDLSAGNDKGVLTVTKL